MTTLSVVADLNDDEIDLLYSYDFLAEIDLLSSIPFWAYSAYGGSLFGSLCEFFIQMYKIFLCTTHNLFIFVRIFLEQVLCIV